MSLILTLRQLGAAGCWVCWIVVVVLEDWWLQVKTSFCLLRLGKLQKTQKECLYVNAFTAKWDIYRQRLVTSIQRLYFMKLYCFYLPHYQERWRTLLPITCFQEYWVFIWYLMLFLSFVLLSQKYPFNGQNSSSKVLILKEIT